MCTTVSVPGYWSDLSSGLTRINTTNCSSLLPFRQLICSWSLSPALPIWKRLDENLDAITRAFLASQPDLMQLALEHPMDVTRVAESDPDRCHALDLLELCSAHQEGREFAH